MLAIAGLLSTSCQDEIIHLDEPMTNNSIQAPSTNSSAKAGCPDIVLDFKSANNPAQEGARTLQMILPHFDVNVPFGKIQKSVNDCGDIELMDKIACSFNDLNEGYKLAVSQTNADWEVIKEQVCAGYPVVAKAHLDLDPSSDVTGIVIITGWDDGHIMCSVVTDPNGDQKAFPVDEFSQSFEALGSVALIYS